MKAEEIQEERKYSETLRFATTKQYGLVNLGITDKMSFDWRKAGVYLQDKKTKYRMKYSPVEYIWLLLVKECREFGLPIKSVIRLKDFLLGAIDVEKLLLAIQDSKADSEIVIVQEASEDEDLDRTVSKQNIVPLEDHIVNSMFTSMIVSTLLKEKEYVLFLKKDGLCLIETLGESELNFSGFLSESCLMIPFNTIVGAFLEKENVDGGSGKKKGKRDGVSETFDFEFLKKGFVKKTD